MFFLQSASSKRRFCPGVRVHKGITIVLSLFRSHWLAVVYCLLLCSGSCEPVHEDRTKKALRDTFKFKFKFSLCASSVVKWQIVVKLNIPLFRYFYNHLSNYTKTIIRLRLVNIGEYSPRLRLGEYSPIFTSPSANNC